MTIKQMQMSVLRRMFQATYIGTNGIEIKLFDEYTDIDEIKREEELTQAQVQNGEHSPLVIGIVQSLPSQLTPIASLENISQSQIVTFFVPIDNTSRNDGDLSDSALRIIDTLNSRCRSFTGSSGTENVDGKNVSWVITPQLPVVGQMNNTLGYWAVDVSVTIGWQITSNGFVSNLCKISINGQEVPWLDLTIGRTRVPEPVNYANNGELVTHIIQQGLTINLALPILLTGPTQELLSDAIMGQVNKMYRMDIRLVGTQARRSIKVVATQITPHFSVGLIGSLSVEFAYAGEL